MKHLAFFLIFILLILLFSGCNTPQQCDLAATTLPVYEFTSRLCHDTPLRVERLITENVSCLHDYTLQIQQMRAIQGADAVVISGAGLEDFLADALSGASYVVDASQGLTLLESTQHHDHSHDHADPHIWLSPKYACVMAENICRELQALYPQYADIFSANLDTLVCDLEALQNYGAHKLQALRCRGLITFHDGFAYLAESFGLTILEAVEEESGSEASAAQLKHLIDLITDRSLPAMFTEKNGAVSAAQIIARETGAAVYALDMAMAGESYLEAMYQNIDTLWEALQ